MLALALNMAGITLPIGWARVLWSISGALILFAIIVAIRAYVVPLFRKGESSALKVTIPCIKIGRMVSNNNFILLVTVKFEPSAPIQLGKLDLVYKPSALSKYITSSPLGRLPTKLVERVETYEVEYEISGFRGDFLLETGFREKKNIPESKWPQAYLHVLAGNLDFNTDKVPMPTPTWMLASGKEDSQN